MHRVRLVGTFRLLVTFMALACAMAGPAAAMPAMKAALIATHAGPSEATAEDAMPCHEAALASVAGQLPHHDAGAISEKPAAVGLHLCCVMATLVVTPLKPTLVAHPSPRFALLVPGAPNVMNGRIVAMPTPPPRIS